MPRKPRHAERTTATPATARPTARRALLYCRVSTDEQADRGYSLRDQEARLRAYCQAERLDVAGVHVEDRSAKTFDRPEWARLLARAEGGEADVVLVTKWDRFSRDARGALAMIARLDDAGVRVQAVEQPIESVDEVPEQLLMLSFYVAAPEVENRRRSLATKQGMRRAMREGRYVSAPPHGYRRGYDGGGRYLVEPDPEQAPHVREAFRLAADTDEPMEAIRRRLWAAGLRVSRNQFTLMLRNPLYCGRLVVPAWRGEPEAVVDGLHEPLVDRPTFDAVQARRFAAPDARSRARRRLVDELPLRGHLLCPDAHAAGGRVVLTGSASRARSGARVWYYHGQAAGPSASARRFRADRAHDALAEMLGELAVPREVAALWRRLAEADARDGARQAERRARAARAAVDEVEGRLATIDERHFVAGDMARDAYDRLRTRYLAERERAAAELRAVEGAAAVGAEAAAFVAALAADLPRLWAAADAAGRSALAGSIWPDGLVFDGEGYRTTPPSPVLALFSAGGAGIADAEPEEGPGVLCGSPRRTRIEPDRRAERPPVELVVARAWARGAPLRRLVRPL